MIKKPNLFFLPWTRTKRVWCSYLKRTEIFEGTILGELMGHEDPIGQQVLQVFNKYDKNGDMRLSLAELKKMVGDQDSNSTDADCELIFTTLDKDKSGSITF